MRFLRVRCRIERRRVNDSSMTSDLKNMSNLQQKVDASNASLKHSKKESSVTEDDEALGSAQKVLRMTYTSSTYAALLQKCVHQDHVGEVKWIHAHLLVSNHRISIYLGNCLLHAYSKLSSLEHARKTFNDMENWNSFSWNILLGAYVRDGRLWDAQNLFGRIPERDVVSWTTMVSAHVQWGDLKYARKLFDKMPERNKVSWTAMITGYSQHGHGKQALYLFEQMQLQGFAPDRVAFIGGLDACASEGALIEGTRLHHQIQKRQLENDIAIGTALVNMYGKCGSLEQAQNVFDNMSTRSLMSWTAMITAYAHNGHSKKAIDLFVQMQLSGLTPDKVTYLSILDACANCGALGKGRQLHASIIGSEIESDVIVSNAFVNFYGKCGCLNEARTLFDQMLEHNVVTWAAMIGGYAQQGHVRKVFQLFEQMQVVGILPNRVTLISMLSACNHAGLLNKGYHFFLSSSLDYKVTPTVEHYNCMIDQFGRGGWLDEARELIKSMPFKPTATSWTGLLGACGIIGNVEQGKYAAMHLFELDSENAGPYALLSNLLAADCQCTEES